MHDNGVISRPSRHSVVETLRLLEETIASRGLTVFARIDHAANAVEYGLSLRPTMLLIFGHARGGTPLMQDRQIVGLDLPLKALVWEDASGRVWLAYNDAKWLADRHGLSADVSPAVETIVAGMVGIAVDACD